MKKGLCQATANAAGVIPAGLFALALAASAVAAEPVAGAKPPPGDRFFAVDEQGYIRNWLGLPNITLSVNVSAHTEAVQKPFFDREFFKGQKAAAPAEGGKVVVDGRELSWSAVQTDGPAWNMPEVENSIAFGVAYVICTQEMAGVVLSIGSDDSSLWRLNGVEVVRFYGGRGVTPDENQSPPLALKQGLNVLSVAVINGSGPCGASARFLDRKGNPVRNVRISLNPRQTPLVSDGGVSEVTAKTATVHANLTSAGTADAFLFVFHGPKDGGTNRNAWAVAGRLQGPSETGLRKVRISHGSSNTMWRYRICATNKYGAAWAETTGSFMAGAVDVRSTRRETTEERPASFVIYRPATATNGPLSVNFTVSGGVNGVDFDYLDNPVTIPAGASEISLPVIPSSGWAGDTRPKVVSMEIAPGGYFVGTNGGASILTRPK